jgi:hypothetical protein
MIYCGHSQTPLWLYIWMTSSSSTKLGRNIWSIFNRYWAPCDNTSYMPIWRSVPSTCRESSIWDTSWMSMVYMWIHPRSKSSMIGQAPKIMTELCSFLGLANFYQWFMLGFSHIAWALSQVTKGGMKESFLLYSPQQK